MNPKIYISVFLLNILSALPVFSQVFTYTNANQFLSCEKNVYYFEDKTKGLNFENIHKLPDKAFKKSADSTVNFGITESVIWVYFDLKNFTNECLYLSIPLIQKADVFLISENDSLTIFETGIARPFQNRFLKTYNNNISIGFHPKRIYLKLSSNGLILMPLAVGSIKATVDFYHNRDALCYLLLGIVLAIGLYNFILFFTLRDRIFIIYFLYSITSFLLIAQFEGLSVELFKNSSLKINETNHLFSFIPYLLVVHWFIIEFLELKQTLPKIYNLLKITFSFLVLAGIIELLGISYIWSDNIVIYTFVAFIILAIWGGIQRYTQGLIAAKYYLFAFGWLFLGIIAMVLIKINMLSVGVFAESTSLLYFGIVGENIFFSFAIAYRFNILRQEVLQANRLAMSRLHDNEIQQENFEKQIANHLQAQSKSNQKLPDIETFMSLLKDLPKKVERISISTLEGVIFIPVDDIVRVEAMGNYTTLHLSNKKKFTASKSIGDLEILLLAYNNFFKINRSYIINVNFVERYLRGEGGSVVLADGSEIGVSRNTKAEFLEKFNLN